MNAEYDKGYQSGYDAGYKRAMLDYGLEDDKPCENAVLNKIRAEIEMEKQEDFPNFCIMAHNGAIERVLQIIDKYKESEVGNADRN